MFSELPECIFDYENVIVACPHCGKENIYNRVSDLKTIKWVSSFSANCMHCGKIIPLSGDFINPAYQMILYKTYRHKEAKEYMQSIITICTAYEMLFMFTLRLFLTIKPLKNFEFSYQRIEPNKRLNEALEHKVETFAFRKMLNEFIKVIIRNDSCPIETLEASEDYIANMNGNPTNVESIRQIKDKSLRNQLVVLYKLKEKNLLIDSIRNKVVHKQGYRPSLEEVEREITIARNIIFKITGILHLITDDVVVYYEMHSQ